MTRLAVFILCLVCVQNISKEHFYNFVIWNTGQGSWATYLNKDHCHHFDMGGEKFDQSIVLQNCQKLKNQLYISHLDWDHINKIKSFTRKTKHFCIFFPRELSKKWLKKIEKCKNKPKEIQMIYAGANTNQRNGKSVVYLLKHQVLLPGDSTMKQEKKWLNNIPKRIKLLVLGHHGSHTSTSIALLKRAQPKMAIASARKSRYGHPHHKVLRKLKRFNIPLLKTEDLGNLYFMLNDN